MHHRRFNPIRSFRSFFGLVVFVIAVQSAPVLAVTQTIEPANGVVGVAINPTLEISCNDSGVVAAQYEIATDNGFANVVYNSLETVNDLCSHIALAQLDPLTQYYWRARLRDDQGNWSSWSLESSFTTSDVTALYFNVFQDGVSNYGGTNDVDIRGSAVDPTQVIRNWDQGAQDVLRTGRRIPGSLTDEIYRTLVRFDLSALSNPNAVVNAYIEFTGWEHGPAKDNIEFLAPNSMYEVVRRWGEGDGFTDSAPTHGESSWVSSYHPEQWNIPGVADASDSNPNADRKATPLVKLVATNQVGYKTLWSSQALVETIKNWIANPSGNHGVILKADNEGIKKMLFLGSREHSDPSFHPRLVVVSSEQAFPGQNQAPVAIRDMVSIGLDTQVSISVLVNDLDQDGDSSLLSIVNVGSPQHGTANIVGNQVVYQPNQGYVGIDQFLYSISDGADNASAFITVGVGDLVSNVAPVATNDNYNGTQDVVLNIKAPGILTNDSDANGDPLIAALDTNASHGTVVLNPDGSFTYTPTGGFSGTDSFTYTAQDPSGLVSNLATVMLIVNPLGGSPVTVTFQQEINGYGGGLDTFLNESLPTTTLGKRPMVKWKGGSSQMIGLLRFEDVMGGGAGQIPAGATIQSATLLLDVSNDGDAADIYESAVDWTEDETYNTFGGEPDVQEDELGSLVQAANGGRVGLRSYSIDVTASLSRWVNDPSSNRGWIMMSTGSKTVEFHSAQHTTTTLRPQLTVTYLVGSGGNQAPVVTSDSYNGTQDTVLSISAPGVLTNDSDPNGDPLNAVLDTNASHGTVALNSDGSFTYTPMSGFSGPDSFTYHAYDGAVASNVVTVTLNINGAPVATEDSATTVEGVAVSIVVLTNDSDDTGLNAASVVVQSGPSHGSTNVDSGTGAITYTPAASYLGMDTFTYTVQDLQGVESNVATVTVEIMDGNVAPVAVGDSYNGTQDTQLNIAAQGVLTNDSDANGDPLNAVLDTNASHGTVALNSDGSFTYTPTSGFSGPDSFTYHADDGAVASNVVTVTLHINGAPVATEDSATTVEGVAVSIAVLTNDTDDTGLNAASVVVQSGPSHGSTNVDSGTGAITYTPAASYLGMDTFTYTVQDLQGVESNVATVTVEMTDGNMAPVAVGDGYNGTQDTVLSISAPGVLTNDSDPNGDPLNAVLDTNASHGTVALNSDGSFTYTPTSGFSGPDSFTYHADDGVLGSNVVTVTVNIKATGSTTTPVTVTFQEGENGYVGTQDTFVRDASPNADNGDRPLIRWLLGSSKLYGLLKFENIFGSAAEQIPVGVIIQSATITVEMFRGGGDAADLYESAVVWTESESYNSFGGDPDVQGDELGVLVQPANGAFVSSGSYSLDVTESLSRWSADPGSNQGWVFVPTDVDLGEFRSSEYRTSTLRPRLTVIYIDSGGN